MKITSVKKTPGKTAKKAVKGAPAPVSLQFQDNQDATATTNGVDSAGDTLDISTVATEVVTSDTPAVCSVDTPVGMTVACHGLTVGTANLTFVATWNDNSVGPFTFVVPVTVTTSAATGLVVTFGTPTIRP